MSDGEVVFRQMYTAHRASIQAYCFRRIPAADANDAAAEVFTTAWRRLADAPSPERHLPWLYGIARNVVANASRSRRRSDRLQMKLRGLRHHPVASPEPEIVRREVERAVLEAMALLRPQDQEILRLRTWEELPNEDIAEIFGLSVRAVESRLTRIRRKLARLVTEPEAAPFRGHPLAVEEGGER
ncbi:MAG: sigma-70 family RNA polymerase sigma factor [Acidimicrobiia bacterium]|nr:sigma-70 family RNA polymerase sigma factor [Acidimicrobiia bacterium]